MSSGTLPPHILKYASISKHFEVLQYWRHINISVQYFDIEVQHFDIEATKKLWYQSFFDIEAACFYIGCQNLRASISKCMYFDIDIWILRYWSTFIEYRTLYRSTSISKLKNFDIEVHWNWIQLQKLKHFDIEVVYAISKTFQKLRYRSQHFDIVSQTHILRYRGFFTLHRRYLKNFDIEDVTSISKVLLRYKSLFQGLSRSLSNESQHPVSFIHATDSDILCLSRICIM